MSHRHLPHKKPEFALNSGLIFRTGTGAANHSDRHGGLALRVVLSKWHGRDNPLWLSCIQTGTGAAVIRTGTGAWPYGSSYRSFH